MNTYLCPRGKTFQFNDYVCMETLIGVPDEKRCGRLIQVRKGCGQFGTDLYFLRLRDGSLMTFSNVLMRHVSDKEFEKAFYILNGATPPVCPDQPICPDDSTEVEYSIRHEWPETGFIVEHPKQPEIPGAFALTIFQEK